MAERVEAVDWESVGRRYAGWVLAVVRRLRRLEQKDVAAFLGVSINHVAQVEAGMTSFREPRFQKVCEYFEVDPEIVRMLAYKTKERIALTSEEQIEVGEWAEMLFRRYAEMRATGGQET